MTITAILFDCDGVLLDSEARADGAVADVMLGFVPSMMRADFLARFRGLPDREIAEVLGRERGVVFPDDLHQRVVVAVDAAVAEAAPIAGMGEVISALKPKPVVVSNAPAPRLRAGLSRSGLLEMFGPHIFDASLVANPKPAPDLHRLTLTRLGLDARECLAIEDNLRGVRAAVAAGVPTIGFLGGSHVRPSDADALRAAGVIAIAETAAELARLINDRT